MGCRLQGLTREERLSRFYLVIVSTILLYGSDTWVVTRRMADLLTSFTTDASGTLRDGAFVVSIPRTMCGSDRRWLLWRKPCC
jgi:hypothetical protein